MTASKASRFLDSPLLLVCLILFTGLLAVKAYTLYAASNAPAFRGWDWSRHPQTLLVAYPSPSCGCGPTVPAAVRQGLAHHLDVLVVTDLTGKDAAALTTGLPDTHVHLIAEIGQSFMHRLSPNGKTALKMVRQGRVTRILTGGVIPDGFFQ